MVGGVISRTNEARREAYWECGACEHAPYGLLNWKNEVLDPIISVGDFSIIYDPPKYV